MSPNFETIIHTENCHNRRGVHTGYLTTAWIFATLKPAPSSAVTRTDASRDQSSTTRLAGMYTLWPAQDEGNNSSSCIVRAPLLQYHLTV
jgi:hypothetical protein